MTADGDSGRGPKPLRRPSVQDLALKVHPQEVTSQTFSYVDALLTGRMSPAELARIRSDLASPGALITPPSFHPPLQDDPIPGLEKRVADRDFAGALHGAESIALDSPHYAAACSVVRRCREELATTYLAHLGTEEDVPQIAISMAELEDAALDQWEAYALALVDGEHTVGEIVDMTSFPRLDALRLLYELFARKLIRMRGVDAPSPPSPRPSCSDGQAVARVRLQKKLL